MVVWATGPVVSVGSFLNTFLQLNWTSFIMGSNPIGSLIKFIWHEFISFLFIFMSSDPNSIVSCSKWIWVVWEIFI